MGGELRDRLAVAARAGEVLRVVYHGGSQPGAVREISPIRVADAEVAARDLATDIVKVFKLAKIELADRGTNAPEYDPTLTDGHADPQTIGDAFDEAKLSELEALGWHVVASKDSISTHRFFKNGNPRKTPDVCLAYHEFVVDDVYDDDTGDFREEKRRSKRPYRVDSRRFSMGRSFGRIRNARALFLGEAYALAPNVSGESR